MSRGVRNIDQEQNSTLNPLRFNTSKVRHHADVLTGHPWHQHGVVRNTDCFGPGHGSKKRTGFKYARGYCCQMAALRADSGVGSMSSNSSRSIPKDFGDGRESDRTGIKTLPESNPAMEDNYEEVSLGSRMHNGTSRAVNRARMGAMRVCASRQHGCTGTQPSSHCGNTGDQSMYRSVSCGTYSDDPDSNRIIGGDKKSHSISCGTNTRHKPNDSEVDGIYSGIYTGGGEIFPPFGRRGENDYRDVEKLDNQYDRNVNANIAVNLEEHKAMLRHNVRNHNMTMSKRHGVSKEPNEYDACSSSCSLRIRNSSLKDFENCMNTFDNIESKNTRTGVEHYNATLAKSRGIEVLYAVPNKSSAVSGRERTSRHSDNRQEKSPKKLRSRSRPRLHVHVPQVEVGSKHMDSKWKTCGTNLPNNRNYNRSLLSQSSYESLRSSLMSENMQSYTTGGGFSRTGSYSSRSCSDLLSELWPEEDDRYSTFSSIPHSLNYNGSLHCTSPFGDYDNQNVYSHNAPEFMRSRSVDNLKSCRKSDLLYDKKSARHISFKQQPDFIVDNEVTYGCDPQYVSLCNSNMPIDYFCELFMRKQDLRELKVLQKIENKQYQDLVYKAQYLRENQEKRFETEMQTLLKNFETDIESLNKQQKQQVERAEVTQSQDLRHQAKRIQLDQERELKSFRDDLKKEMKLLKHQVDMMPREVRKEAYRRKKEEKDLEQSQREREFMERQQETMDRSMKRLAEQHKEKVALLERQFLQQKQQLLRAREAAIWELEERQLHEKHQLAKRQLKDLFFLKRHQMLTRHEKELEQVRRVNDRNEEEMIRRHVLEKKRLPRIQKTERKTRGQMFRESLNVQKMDPNRERERLKQFDESEKRRIKSEQHRQEAKHRKQWDDLKSKNETAVRELEQLQGEKRKMLMEHETQKIRELDDQYQSELKEWKGQLRPRKQALEEEFGRQLKQQEEFYGHHVFYPESDRNSNRSGSPRSDVATGKESVRGS